MLKHWKHLKTAGLFGAGWSLAGNCTKLPGPFTVHNQSDSLYYGWQKKHSSYQCVGWHSIVGLNNTLAKANREVSRSLWWYITTLSGMGCSHLCSQGRQRFYAVMPIPFQRTWSDRWITFLGCEFLLSWKLNISPTSVSPQTKLLHVT